jgi:hypothetical protein
MARSRRRSLKQVEPGDAFALPMEDGRWAACHVLGKSADPFGALVLSCAWVGNAPPEDPLAVEGLRTPLVLTHHHWEDVNHLSWVDEPVPAEAVPLGKLPLSEAEKSLREEASHCGWAGWGSFQIQPLLQWRWDHDRAAVLAEDERETQRQAAARQEAEFGYRTLPPSMEEMAKRKVYPGRDNYPTPEEVRLSRQIVRQALDALIALGPDAHDAEKFDVMRRAVERFNEEADFIDTAEREYLCEVLGDIGDAAGLLDYDVTAWRDW